jgi:hypothetical protein
MTAGRPKRSEAELLQDRAKVQAQIFGANNSVFQFEQEEIYLPPPPAKKGTSLWKAWAMECFLECVRYGLNYSDACKKIGVTRKWWEENSQRHPEWAEEAKSIRSGEHVKDSSPDLSEVSFAEFCELYFGVKFAEHQHRIAKNLEDPMGRLVLVLGHPESGKSTLSSLWYPIYRMCKNPDIRIALVTKSGDKAQDLLNRIKRYLTDPHLYNDCPRNLIRDFNGFKPQRQDGFGWSKDQITIRQRESGERDPTIQALSVGKQIYGARLDLLILDDALTLENQQTDIRRSRIDEWFTQEARSRAQRGQTLVNGTRVHPLDNYGQWKDSWADHKIFRYVKIPALLDEHTEKERPSWHEYWSLDGKEEYDEATGGEVFRPGLRDIRAEIVARDPMRWKLVYQQEDVQQVESIFRQEMLDKAFELGGSRSLGQVYPDEILILGVDPATTGRAASVLLAYNPETEVRTVVDLYVGHRLGATGIRNKLLYEFWEKYNDHRVAFTVIETNFAPTILGDDTLKAHAEWAGTRLVDHRTTGQGNRRGNKWDNEFGIGSMASLFHSGLVAFPSATVEDKSKLAPLVDDMLVFPWSRVQDALIAFWVANGECSGKGLFQVDMDKVVARRNIPPIIQERMFLRNR